MLITERERLRHDIETWVARYGHYRSALIPILQEVKKKYFHIDDYAMQVMADLLGIHPVEVYSVVSFYSFLREEPTVRFVVRLCQTVSCEMKGKDRIVRQLENDLGIAFGQSTSDAKFSLEWTSCLGQCDRGPAMLINEHVFTRVTPDLAHSLIEECKRTFGKYRPKGEEVCQWRA